MESLMNKGHVLQIKFQDFQLYDQHSVVISNVILAGPQTFP